MTENWNPNTAGPSCDWCGECPWCLGLRQVYAPGWQRPDGSVFNIGMSEAGYANPEAAQKALDRAQAEHPDRTYVLITKYESDWRPL